MNDFLLLMHNDAVDSLLANDAEAWERYFALLQQSGSFAGGSEIGLGRCFRKEIERSGTAMVSCSIHSAALPQANSNHLTGFIRLRVANMAAAEAFLSGNPVYDAGGTVEIRELPSD
jgi:hypothetical protein